MIWLKDTSRLQAQRFFWNYYSFYRMTKMFATESCLKLNYILFLGSIWMGTWTARLAYWWCRFENAKYGDCYSEGGSLNAGDIDLLLEFDRGEADLQPENQALLKYIRKHNFILSAQLGAGSLGIQYPYLRPPEVIETFHAWFHVSRSCCLRAPPILLTTGSF